MKRALLLTTTLAFLIAAQSASAATIFGAKVDTTTATTQCNLCLMVGYKHYDSSLDSGSPASGILTKVRVRYLGPELSGVVRLETPTGLANQFRNDGEAALNFTATSTPGGVVESFPTRLKIASGTHLAIGIQGNAYYAHGDSDAQCASVVLSSSQPPGQNLTFIPGNCGPNDLLAEGTVEADADGDGFGDETQDCVPTDPAKTVCPPAAKPKCKKKKKKHRHSATAAKKKKHCKKKKRKK